MNITVRTTITTQTAPPPAENIVIYHTCGYGYPQMIEYYNLSTQTDGRGKGNYNHWDNALINLVTLKSQNGGRQAPLLLSASDMAFVNAIQPQDSYSVQEKMNWFGEGREEDAGRPCWEDGNRHKCDSIVYGDALVRIKMDSAVGVIFDFPNGQEEKHTFYMPDYFKREMMDMELGEYVDYEYPFVANGTTVIIPTRIRANVIPLIEQGFIEVATEAQIQNNPYNPNKIVATARGIKLWPLFDPAEGAQYPEWSYHLWEGGLVAR